MSTEIVKPHNFVEAKEKIDKLVKNMPSTTNLKQFREKKFIFSSTPTGKELNEQLVSPLQNIFIDVNNNVRSLYDIISNLYKTIESLDDEYIKAIILAIKSIEEVSNQAKTASDNAERASKKAFEASQDALKVSKEVKTAQSDIKKTINALGATVEILKDFRGKVNEDITSLQQYRSKLETYKHLCEVDNIWNDVEGQKTDLAKFHQQVDGFIENANKATDLIKQDVSSLQQYRSKLETYKHLCEVDNIWNDVEGQKTDLAKFHQQVDGFIESANKATDLIKQDVSSLQQHRSKLETYKHLCDVDNMWGEVEAHKTDLTKLHQQVAKYISEVNATHAEIKDSIRQIEEDNCSAHLKYEKKIKTAYYIGGSAICLLIINYILQILGIL